MQKLKIELIKKLMQLSAEELSQAIGKAEEILNRRPNTNKKEEKWIY